MITWLYKPHSVDLHLKSIKLLTNEHTVFTFVGFGFTGVCLATTQSAAFSLSSSENFLSTSSTWSIFTTGSFTPYVSNHISSSFPARTQASLQLLIFFVKRTGHLRRPGKDEDEIVSVKYHMILLKFQVSILDSHEMPQNIRHSHYGY